MLGNDIIDLKLAATQSNWRRKGYLEKIFTSREQQLITDAANQDQMVWLLWSMKEAAYKIVSPLIGERFYEPKAFSCFIDSFKRNIKGRVIFREETLFTSSKIASEMVYTTAVSEQNHKLQQHFLTNHEAYVAHFNGSNYRLMLIKPDEDVPTIKNRYTGEHYPVSISHHGRFLAIVHPAQIVKC